MEGVNGVRRKLQLGTDTLQELLPVLCAEH